MTLYRIGKLFLDEYISSFDKAPKKIIVDADDTNANTYGAQQLSMVDKQKRRAESDYLKAQKVEDDRYETLKRLKYPDVRHERIVIRRYYKLEYKAQSWKYAQRVIAKIEVSAEGTNIRFVVTKNRNNSPETVYRRYCGRGEMELWIKDLKYFKADRMSCSSFRANYFRLFLYAAAFVLAHRIKHTVFRERKWNTLRWTALSSASCSVLSISWRRRHISRLVSRLTIGIGKSWRRHS